MARELPENDFMKYLIFIKDVLLTISFGRDYNIYQQNLIDALSDTSFVRVGRTCRKVCELKSPKNRVFKLMCTAEDFPSTEFDMEEWFDFFVRIDLQTRVTDTQYLKFAHTIALEGRMSGITDELEEKSVALTENLLTESKEPLSSNTVLELSKIKFLVPARVEQCYSDLFRQQDDASSLICFDGSVTFECGESFWTTVHILPKIADLNSILLESSGDKKWLCDNLNILPSPTDEQIILHCQNVGHALKAKVEEMKADKQPSTWISSLMNRIYAALEKIDKHLLKDRLFHAPLVFLPFDSDILPAYMTILDCNAAHEIPPYLRKSPVEFGRYQSLFQTLGASPEPSLTQYIDVLHTVQRSAGEKELIPFEYEVVRSAISNMLEVLKNSEHQTNGNLPSRLYLPDSESKLKDATLLVISDSSYIKTHIEGVTSLSYFLGLEKLNLANKKVELLKKLRPEYRPLFLTEITDQKVDSECIDKFRSKHSIRLENFFHSAEFASGILRLLKAFWHETIPDEEEVIVIMAFQSIKVWQVTRLRTYMMLKTGDAEWIRIQHSEDDDRECYIEKDSDGSTSFYFVASEPDDGFRWDNLADDIIIMVQEILQSKLDFRYISLLISYIGREEQIPTRLNRMRVPDYSVSKTVEKSLFPAPGTYVPVKFHPFLDNAKPIFEMHEYRFVAMEKYDPLTDDENNDDSTLAASYIYVTIMERIDKNSGTFPMYQRYRVDVGELQYVTVPAYKLYRFLRSKNMVRDVVLSDFMTDRATIYLETTQDPSETPKLQLYSDACKEIRECLRKSWDTTEQRSIIKGERGGSVVECRTPEREVRGSRPTSAVLCP